MTVKAGSQDGQVGASGADENGSDDAVSYETYKKVLDQRKADRDRARELQARLDAAEAEKAEAEKARLAEQARFKELYESEKKRAETLHGQIQSMTSAQIDARKREALKSELGGVRKDDYLNFADLKSIQVNEDGSVDVESVKAVATKYRESYPELVATRQASKLPQDAAGGYKPPQPKSLAEMSPSELRAEYARTQLKK
jgi:hypothetical protein